MANNATSWPNYLIIGLDRLARVVRIAINSGARTKMNDEREYKSNSVLVMKFFVKFNKFDTESFKKGYRSRKLEFLSGINNVRVERQVFIRN